MNYLHHYHAGNFADVLKHTLLIQLIRGLQRKERGLLYLDTHAGRGLYDLTSASQGDRLDRQPEWPQGIGRLWTASDLPSPLSEYVALVRACDAKHGGAPDSASPSRYPGSPLLAHVLARPQDRLALCELHTDEVVALRRALPPSRRPSVRELDGYSALRAMLPPLERRALVLIDPPFETQDEYANILDGLAEGLQRLPGGTFAVWYPLTERARNEDFFSGLRSLRLPPTWTVELTVADEESPLKMRGCGLLVLNPPWQIDSEIIPWLPALAELLAQYPGANADLRWLVHE